MLKTRIATINDALELASRLRQADYQEIEALTGKPPKKSLIRGIILSDIPIAIVNTDGHILGLFGVTTVTQQPKTGMIWLLASKGLLDYRIEFLKKSRCWIAMLQRHYDVLYNIVDERNKVHIRWLTWCGFTFIKRHTETGIEKRPFIEFVRIK